MSHRAPPHTREGISGILLPTTPTPSSHPSSSQFSLSPSELLLLASSSDDDEQPPLPTPLPTTTQPTHTTHSSFLHSLQQLAVDTIRSNAALTASPTSPDDVMEVYLTSNHPSPSSPTLRASRLAEQASIARDSNDPDGAVELLVEAIALARVAHGKDSAPVRDLHAQLGNVHLDRSEWGAAKRHTSAALKINKALPPEEAAASHPRLLLALGSAALGAKRWKQAAYALNTALRANAVVAGETHFSNYDIYVRLGELAEARGDYPGAARSLERARPLLQRELGADKSAQAHASLLLSLTTLELKLGDLAAEEGGPSDRISGHYLAAHTAGEAAADLVATVEAEGSHVQRLERDIRSLLTDVKLQIGLFYVQRAAGDDAPHLASIALKFLREAYARLAGIHGRDGAQTLAALKEVALCLLLVPDHQAALEVLQDLLAAELSAYGESSNAVAETHALLGRLYLSEHPTGASFANPVKALLHFENAFAILSAKHGLAHPRTRALVAEAAELRTQLDKVNFMDDDELFHAVASSSRKSRPRARRIAARRRRRK